VLKPGMSKLGDHLANNKRWQYSNLITVTLYFLYDRETFKLTVLKSIEHNRVDKISAYLFDGRYVLRYES
jgi:ribosomal protein L28